MRPRERQIKEQDWKRKRSTSQQLNAPNVIESFHQTPESTQKKKLQELNNDCLIAIFIKLDGCDLIQLLSMHSNFKEPVRCAFAVLYKYEFYELPSRHPSIKELTKFVLRHVGDKISCLELRPSDGWSANELFREVMKYSSRTAERIKIFQSSQGDLMEDLPQFPNLVELSFKFGEISSDLMMFQNWCPNLTRLSFYGITFPDSHFLLQISHLEHIYLKENRNLNANNLMHFFNKNPQLRSIQFEYPGEFTREFFSAMSRNLPVLEKLEIYFDNFLSFDRSVTYEPLYFQNLKSLAIHAHEDNYTHILNNLAISNEILEVFELAGTVPTWTDSHLITTNPLIRYKNLKKIRFKCSLMLYNLSILDFLPNLEVAHFEELELDQSFEEIIDIVRKNKSLKFVQFEYFRNNDDVKLNLQFYGKFCIDFKKRDELIIKMIERERNRFVEISNKRLCIGNLINGSKRVMYSSAEMNSTC